MNEYINLDSIKEYDIQPSDYKYGHYFIKYKSELKYYFKTTSNSRGEIIASILAKKLDIPTVNYNLASYNNLIGVVSENFKNKDYKYVDLSEILKNYFYKNIKQFKYIDPDNHFYYYMTNLINIWQALEDYYKNDERLNIKELMEEFVKLYIFNIFIGRFDTFSNNYVIEERNDSIHLAKAFDFGEAFNSYTNTIGLNIDEDNYNQNIEDSLLDFLNTSDEYFVNLFFKMFNKFDSEHFEEILDEYEKRTKSNYYQDDDHYDEIIKEYKTNYDRIKNVVDKFTHKKRAK